jgi:uncharacterized membrane protein YkvI
LILAKKQEISAWTVASTYIATCIGTGFASGQEVFAYFGHFGRRGLWGVALAGGLLALLALITLRVARKVNATDHLAVISRILGPVGGQILDYAVVFLLFTGAGTMLAGSGATVAEHFGLSPWIGSLLMAGVTFLTVLGGLSGVTRAFNAVTPFLLVLILGVALVTVFRFGVSPAQLHWYQPARAGSHRWWLASVLFVSYNFLVGISVLSPLGGRLRSKQAGDIGAVVGGLCLGLGILLVDLALLGTLPASAQYQVPMLFLAGLLPRWVTLFYTVALLLALYTTAVGSVLGLSLRLATPGTKKYATVVLTTIVGSLLLSQVGFSVLVSRVLPALGWVGLFLIGGILLAPFRRGSRVRQR